MFEESLITVTSWLQGTSRDGDPQDHVHNQIARLVKTVSDGKWRALDTVCLRQVLGAVQAIVATHVECGLTAEFGVQWVPRADGKGNEIAGISQQLMDAYSSRTVAITSAMPAAIASWTAKYGRAPNKRELLYIRQEATLASRRGKDARVIDWDKLASAWDARIGGELASLALRVSPVLRAGPGAGHVTHADGTRDARAGADGSARPKREELTRTVQRALAQLQAAKSTWTRADLLRQLAVAMPSGTRSMRPEAAVTLLHELADEALTGTIEEVVCLEAPQWPPLPDYLRRELDGRSVYTRPGTTRYATRVQLSMEEQLLRHAQQEGAPHLTRAHAAKLVGADPAALDPLLSDHAAVHRTQTGQTAAGLRLDQAGALYHALTSARTVEVITGPAGSGKTQVLAKAARAWREAGMGEVLGIATAQAARNVLFSAGLDAAENSAVFLGHVPGQRSARGIRDIRPGSLLVIDEASMMSIPDLLEIVRHAAGSGAKVLIAGDQEQLTAVESGGGMMLLARRLGYVQLAEAVRFTSQWEQDASLRLRTGDPSALDEYRERGRIRGAEPQAALDDAVRRYVSHYLAGRDLLLMIHDRARCQEASRRIRDDLIHLGLVDAGPPVELADGAPASVGDLIICRKNDHAVEAGERGRTLANGDLLRIEAIRARTLLVRRALNSDTVTGTRRWTSRAFEYRGFATADLGYAVIGHSAQGRSVRTSIAVVTGTEDRQWLYVAMTRGAESNTMVVFAEPGKVADPQAGTRPAPELERHAQIAQERAGLPVVDARGPTDDRPEPRDAIAVAADILGNDGAEMSALETQSQAMADADHLAVLNPIWQGETAGLQAERYRKIVLSALPPQYAADGLTSPQATWLWRTIRGVEAAGLDARDVVNQAVRLRSLAGARDLASVINARIRWLTGPIVPQPQRPWSDRVPTVADPERLQFLTELAAAMDARKERIGEHTSEHPPDWAVQTLGEVPDDPLDRLEWQHRAAEIGAYRELYGYQHPTDPIGPEPSGDSPEKRAAWNAAFAVLGPVDGVDLRKLPDGSLLHMRATYETETAWAPRHVGRELEQVRIGADDASLATIRALAEERIARQRGQPEVADRHGTLARSYAAMEAFYREHETELEKTMDVRHEWEHATAASRSLAIAADAELRRRHPAQYFEPLRSAEPLISGEERNQLVLDPGADTYQTPDWITQLAAERRAAAERLDDRNAVLVPSEDPDYAPIGQAWPKLADRDRDAILQPPAPEMRPAATVLQRVADPQAEP